MNAFILGYGARTPAHVPVYTAAAWTAELSAGPHALKRVDLYISSLSEAELAVLNGSSWTNVIALDELVITMASGSSPNARLGDAMGQRCANTIIRSLPSSLAITMITIRNPLPPSVSTDTAELASYRAAAALDELKALLRELDALLNERIAAGTLQHVNVMSSRPYMQQITESEKPRIQEIFPLLTSIYGAL